MEDLNNKDLQKICKKWSNLKGCESSKWWDEITNPHEICTGPAICTQILLDMEKYMKQQNVKVEHRNTS